MATLLCVDGFLLIIYHIANGKTNIVSAAFDELYLGISVLMVILGFYLSLRDCGNSISRWFSTNWYAAIYIILRLSSCIVNDLFADPKFWLSFCYESVFLIAINRATTGTSVVKIFLSCLVAFDLIAICVCSYHYCCLNELMSITVGSYPETVQEGLPFTLIFSNPNPAGMLAGITASACILIFEGSSKTLRPFLSIIIAINTAFLVWSNSRTAIVGLILILAIAIVRRFFKAIQINCKTLIGTALIISFAFLVPVYAITLLSDHENILQNSKAEMFINDMSSWRYNIWKEHILSQNGHYLLGFGTASEAVVARSNFIENSVYDESIQIDESHQMMGERSDLGTHNGYLELILTAGLPATLIILAFLLSRIRSMDNNFIDKHPVILLLVFLFWINVQESRFIVSSVRYTAFLMMLLINWRDNEETDQY